MPIGIPLVSKFDSKGFDQAHTSTQNLSTSLGNIGKFAAVGFAAAAGAAIAFAGSSIKAAAESEAISRGMSNAVRNTELFGNTSADIQKATDALDAHSTKLAEMSGIDDELINQIKTHWMEVPAISAMGIDGINAMATTAANVAAGTGKDIESVSNIFAKALENPESALGKLEKAGIFVTDSQKAMYDSLVASGDLLGAQGFLVETLGDKYAGAAEAAANPFDRLKVIFENLQETVGTALMPVIESVIPLVQEFINTLTSDPAFTTFLTELARAFMDLVLSLTPLLKPVTDLLLTLMPPLMAIIAALAPVVVQLIEAFMPLIEGVLPPLVDLIETLLPPIMELLLAIFIPLVPIIVRLVEAFVPMIEKILPPLLDIVTALVPIFFELIDAFLPLIETLLPPLLDLFLAIVEPLAELLDWILPFIIPMIEDMGDKFKWLTDNILMPLIDGLTKAVEWFTTLLGFDGKEVSVTAYGDFRETNSLTSGRSTTAGRVGARLAEGGVIMPSAMGTFATIGEAGSPEAVIPLDRLDNMMNKRGSGGGAVYNISINAGMGTDGAAVGEQIVTAIRKYERTSGKVFAAA